MNKIFGMKVTLLRFAAIFLFSLLLACSQTSNEADLVLRNGKIVTLDEGKAEVQAIAVKDDIIVAIGSEETIRPMIGLSTKVIDLEGKLAIPGFIEGHGHFMGVGRAKMILDLTKVKNWEEIVQMVAEAAGEAKPGEWITGRGWHQEKWDRTPVPNVDGNPTHHKLSEVSPNNPVRLTHASGHGSIVNAKAMELAGITSETPDPSGGEILRDAGGNPTGVLRETAQGLVGRAADRAQEERTEAEIEADRRRAAELAFEECLAKGITSFQDAGSGFRTIDLFKQLAKDGKLGVRLFVMVRAGNEQLAENLASYKMMPDGDKMLAVHAIKVSIDGALGSHGAWLLEPYTDMPSSAGLNTSPIDRLQETARLAAEHDFQLCVHAIGDRGNREVLNVFEEAFNNNPDKTDLRWRIEHAQHLNAADIPRFGQLGVIASMQGIHCTSDGPWVPKRLGDARSEEGAYVWQKLMKSGAVVTNGTDTPVEDVDPIASFYASVTRKLRGGSVFYPNQRMSRMEALKSYTIKCAYAAFEEDIKGSLTPGKLADITVLSKDILTVPDDDIPSTEVLYTIIGGKVMYEKGS
jgi:predicted amidohydrolase YtcJ